MADSDEESNQSSYESENPYKDTQKKTTESKKHESDNADKSNHAMTIETFVNFLFTAAIVICTIFLVISSFLTLGAICVQTFIYNAQLKEMEKSTQAATKAAKATQDSVILARNSARIDQRAWVAPIEIQSNVLEGQPFQVRVTFKNTGRTFAKDVGVKLVVQVVETSTTPKVDEAEKDVSIKSMAILSPEGIAYGNKASDNILTREHVESIRLGQISVYVHGRIEYTDVFKCPHWTRFCFKLQTDGKDPGTVSYSAYGTRYNQADEEPCATPTPTATP